MDDLIHFEEIHTNHLREMHTNFLRDLSLSLILLENEEVNKSLFEYVQFVGDFELLGELTALTMKK